jgi:hypothetical protein
MEGSELGRALVRRRWASVDARQRVRGKWTGDNSPNAFLTAEQKRAIAKRLTEARWRRDTAKRALQLQAQMDDLRAMADALWGVWRPRPSRALGPQTLSAL